MQKNKCEQLIPIMVNLLKRRDIEKFDIFFYGSKWLYSEFFSTMKFGQSIPKGYQRESMWILHDLIDALADTAVENFTYSESSKGYYGFCRIA